jgi:hypothetical protein
MGLGLLIGIGVMKNFMRKWKFCWLYLFYFQSKNWNHKEKVIKEIFSTLKIPIEYLSLNIFKKIINQQRQNDFRPRLQCRLDVWNVPEVKLLN